jgi:hypothetical protein
MINPELERILTMIIVSIHQHIRRLQEIFKENKIAFSHLA